MAHYWHIITQAYTDYWQYLKHEVLVPSWGSYFYWLLAISLTAWLLESIMPWRTKQAIIRKDFWLDGFYLFFNFFIFSLIGYNAVANVGVALYNNILASFGYTNVVAVSISTWPAWLQLTLMFVIADFIQWNIHRLLHHSPRLWKIHQVHHSAQEMGFATHFRFHFAETILYKTLQYIPLAMIGCSLSSFMIIHIIGIAIGHLNHSNLNWNYGPLKYILNNPRMHLWHHAKELPPHTKGVNYGLSLSIWDYIFGTAYIPHNNANVPLGFKDVEAYPTTFVGQLKQPFD